MNREQHTATLVSITPEAEQQIVKMARVSNPANQNNMATAPKLIRYLLTHEHWSPLEMASMQVEIQTTRAISAQIIRHRSFSFQEFSQRYSNVDLLKTIGLPHLRRQDSKNRQASHDDLDPEMVDLMYKQIRGLYHNSFDYYEYLLKQGVAKECARSILPLGTPTKLFMSGTIRSFVHFCKVRCGVETQLEHRMIADSVKNILKENLPFVHEAAFSEP